MVLKFVITLYLLPLEVSYSNFNNWYTTTLSQDLASRFCFTSCPSGYFCTLKYQQTIANFTIANSNSCKTFCWYAKKCQAFSYTLDTSLCSLYSNVPLWDTLSVARNNSEHVDLLSDMDCWINYEDNPSIPCRSPQDMLETSRLSDGLLVQQHYTKLCLDIGKSGWPAWKDCTSATLWKFRENPRPDHDPNRIAVSVYLADSPDKCLSTIDDPDHFYKIVTLGSCQTDSRDQDFNLKNGSLYHLQQLSSVNMGYEKSCYFQLENFQEHLFTHRFTTTDLGFSLLNILLPSEYQVLCVREELKVEGGVIEGTAPFFLPGSSISISCNPGLGFKEFNFSSSLNITCRDKMTEIPKCSDKSAGDKSAGNTGLIFALLAFGSITPALLFI